MCSGCIEFSAVLWMLHSFSPQSCPDSAKDISPLKKSKFLTLSSQVYLACGTPFAFWEADFQKIKGREILGRSLHDLNTGTD
jgi:hypothetical protein